MIGCGGILESLVAVDDQSIGGLFFRLFQGLENKMIVVAPSHFESNDEAVEQILDIVNKLENKCTCFQDAGRAYETRKRVVCFL